MNKCKISVELFKGVRSVVFQFEHCTIINSMETKEGLRMALKLLEQLQVKNTEIEVL